MADRRNLVKFSERLISIVQPKMVQVVYEEPIDVHDVNLNDIKKRRKIASFLTDNDFGKHEFKKFFTDPDREPYLVKNISTDHYHWAYPVSSYIDSTPERKTKIYKISEIRIIAKPGTIRISNAKYPTNQIWTGEVFGMHIDLLSRRLAAEEYQFITIGELKFKRLSNITSPRIPTQILEKKWNENKINDKKTLAFISSLRIFRIRGDSIQGDERLLPF